MESVFMIFLGFQIILFHQNSNVHAGKVCENAVAQQIKTCNGDRSSPETNCTCYPGWWGRRCEYPRECEIVDDLCAYRGTVNTTNSGKACSPWSEFGTKNPADGSSSRNYCRKADHDDILWCYPYPSGIYEECTIPKCDDQCPPPDLPVHAFVKNPPKVGFQNVSSLTIDCSAGYGRIGSVIQLRCGQNKRWTGTFLGCQTCEDGRYGINCNGTCQCNQLRSNSCNKEDGRCTCITGWAGVTCNTDIDECTSNPCLHDQMCNNTAGSYQCYCPIGTQKNSTGFCEAVRCDLPTLLPNSYIPERKEYYAYQQSFSVACKKGFNTSEQTSFICLANKNLNGLFPNCAAVRCDLPNLLPHSYIPGRKKYYTYQQSFQVACEKGFETSGQTSFTCLANKHLNGTFPNCTAMPENSPEKNKSVIGPVVGVVAAIIVIAMCIIVFVVYRRKHSMSDKQTDSVSRPRESQKGVVDLYAVPNGRDAEEKIYANENAEGTSHGESPNDAYYAFSPGMRPTANAIKVDDFKDYVRKILENEESVFAEFNTLLSGPQMPTTAACEMKNKNKNKYKSMYPYDENRVVLKVKPDKGVSDYINASYINGSGAYRKYIAAQGPIGTSVNDFWRMIWQLKTEHIVMLTNVVEEGKQKCVKYWPDCGKQTFDDVDVTILRDYVRNDYTIREILLEKDGMKRNVTQYHFTVWPDRGVPKYPSSLVNFRSKVISNSKYVQTPLVVHCSAGVGRTGTFIALDYLMDQSAVTGYVDVLGCVETLRRQRVNMVQTKEQYKFLHEVLMDGLIHSSSTIPTYDYADRYSTLQKKGKDSLDSLYVTLQEVTPKIDEKEFTSGKQSDNKRKNRFSNIIAVDSERPYISADSGTDTNYINAVFLPSFKGKRAFLATQMPLPNTIVDFWKLVYEQDVTSIIMLNKDLDDSCGIYWPKSSVVSKFGPFSVVLKDTQDNEFGTSSSLELTYKQERKTVKHFRCTFWPDKRTVPDAASALLNLIKSVQENNDQGVTIVHCLNGADKTGLYCTLATAIQQIELEQEVDLQQIIRRLRHARPQIIPNIEQFRFCHDAVMEYLSQSSIYQNI